MRVLFVTHDVSNYGASRSLQALIAILIEKNIHCELVVRRRLFGTYNFEDLKIKFSVQTIHTLWLPYWSCFVGRKNPLSIKETLWMKINNSLSKLTNRKLVALANRRSIDIIHLNSIVLVDLISSDFRFVVHVRELFDVVFQNVMVSKFTAASGVICIDDVVYEPLKKFEISNLLILPNSYNLLPTEESLVTDRHINFISRIKEKYVMAIIGYVKDEKGINFILEFLNKNKDNRYVLAVIGQGELLRDCKAFEMKDSRLIAYGEENNMSFIYRHVDLVIRGDDVPRIGRTIYEAVYSGTNVLIPGSKSDYPVDLFDNYSENLFFYKTRDVCDFGNKVNSLVNKGKTLKCEKLNTEYNVQSLVKFYKQLMNIE